MSENPYRMQFLRDQPGINRDIPEWDDGLLNFGLEVCEAPGTTELAATTLKDARGEAAQHWRAWRSSSDDPEVKGYWILLPSGHVEDIYIHADADVPVGAF